MKQCLRGTSSAYTPPPALAHRPPTLRPSSKPLSDSGTSPRGGGEGMALLSGTKPEAKSCSGGSNPSV